MNRSLVGIALSLVAIAALAAGCAAPASTPTAGASAAGTQVPAETTAAGAGKAVKIVVIGKSVAPYWSNVELGTKAAAKDLGLSGDQVVFWVPSTEDVASQIQTMETYIAQKVTGIAIAASDPNALEPTMKKAVAAGITVTTLDTPPIEGSVSAVYIGTDNYTAGQQAGEEMKKLLPNGGKVAISRGSDTALNALQRTQGFLDAIKGTQITTLEPLNDKEDSSTALQLALSAISANPDLAGAFGVYNYNGPAWATAVKEANKVGQIKIVCFDATADTVSAIKDGVIAATLAQREYDMGYKSVQMIYKIATEGKDAAFSEMGVKAGVIDTGLDVVSASNLKDYEASLNQKGIPHDWTTQGWTPPAQ